jgi:hypothetical protein
MPKPKPIFLPEQTGKDRSIRFWPVAFREESLNESLLPRLLPPAEWVDATPVEPVWVALFYAIFSEKFEGWQVEPKDGVSTEAALKHVYALVALPMPHEVRERAGAWLLKEWFASAARSPS